MAKIYNKTKIILGIVFAAVVALASFFWYLFGGKVQPLKEGEFIGGQGGKEKIEAVKQKEQLAVAYNPSPVLGVREVIMRTGNLDFIKSGDRVLVKPNVNSDVPTPGTTNPEVVGEIVRLAKSNGAYVIVADSSNPRWDALESMKELGIYKAAKDAGADEILGLDDYEWVRVDSKKAENWPRGFRVSKIVFDVDHIINVPNLHTHSITGHSLALKNLVGLIHSTDRFFFHARKEINEMITEISLAIQPKLTVIEGSKSFLTDGPFSGEIGEPKVYLASFDPVAAEIIGLKLLLKHGAKPKYPDPYNNPQTKRALELELNSLKVEKIEKISKTI